MEGKGKYTGMSKIDAKIRLEYSDETLILRGNFFSKCSKNFSIGLMIMFKVCRRCLQRFSLRCKKNYERTIRTSKYIQKKADPPPNPPQVQSERLEFVVPTSLSSDDTSRVPQESFIMQHASVSYNPICSHANICHNQLSNSKRCVTILH